MYIIYIHVYMHVRCYLSKLPGNPILVITSLIGIPILPCD